MFRIPKYPAVCLISVLASVSVWLADTAGLLDFLNLKSYDTLFCIRAKLDTVRPEAPVVMVDIDDATLSESEFQIPIALWHDNFSRVIEALAESRAKVIGFDFLLPTVLFDDRIKDYSRVWRRAFILARNSGVPVVIGFIQKENRRIVPHKKYVFAAGARNLGFFNLTPDEDDIARRQRLFSPVKNEERLNSFGYLLFRAFKADASPVPEEIYIDFPPHRNFFPRYSFSEVCRKVKEGDKFFLNRHFKDKIIIIGIVDSLSHDRCLTPLRYLNDRLDKSMPGSDIHAAVVQTLYCGRFFQDISGAGRFGICLVSALIAGLASTVLRLRHLVCCLFGLVLLFFLISVYGFLNYTIFPSAAVMTTVGLSLMLSSFYRYRMLDREKRRLHRLFEAFLTPQVAHGVLKLKKPERLEGKKMRLCILFSDIRGFTTFSKKNDDLEVVRRLNEYFGPMSDAVSEKGGVVSRFFGDGLLAFFGAFEATENPSLDGVRAALNMVKKLKVLNLDWQEKGKEHFRIGIGLHTGEVALGGIGSDKRMEFTLTSDTANLASRVESKTKELNETVLISEDVYKDVRDQLPDTIRFEDKGIQEIKGRPAVRLYALKINE